MAEIGNLRVRLSVKDEVTPALRRMRREMWWAEHGNEVVNRLIGAIIFASGVLAGTLVR